MSRYVGYGLLVVAALIAYVVGLKVYAMVLMAEADLHRPGASNEIVMFVLCGIVVPLGIAALLLKKN